MACSQVIRPPRRLAPCSFARVREPEAPRDGDVKTSVLRASYPSAREHRVLALRMRALRGGDAYPGRILRGSAGRRARTLRVGVGPQNLRRAFGSGTSRGRSRSGLRMLGLADT